MKNRSVLFLYGLGAVLTMGMGVLYLAMPTIMPYHMDAIQTPWQDIPPLYQKLFLALLKAAGAGYLAVGAAWAIMTAIPMRRGERWTLWAVPLTGFLAQAPLFAITLYVRFSTPAHPPWIFPLAVIGLIAAGVVVTVKGRGF